jgi:hypothetical protein
MRLFHILVIFFTCVPPPPPPPINNVENILFDKPWPQNRFNNIAQEGGGQEPLLQEGEGQ